MNEKATNLTPNIPTTKSPHDYESEFHEQFYIAEGSAGLLFYVTAHNELDGINDSIKASTTYAIQKAVGKMSEIFENLLDYSLASKNNSKENTIATKAINLIEDDDENLSPNIKKHGPECEFNHQHLIAEGAAGLLFSASSNSQESMNNSVINSAAYSIESAVRQMNKCFQYQLNKFMTEIEEIRSAESTRQFEIFDLVGGVDREACQAIDKGATSETLHKHVLRAISRVKIKATS